MTRTLKNVAMNGGLFTIAASLLVALAAYFFLQTVVEGLISPAIAVIFDEPGGLYTMTFSIDGTDFGYGSVLSALVVLVLALVVVAWAGKVRHASDDRSSDA